MPLPNYPRGSLQPEDGWPIMVRHTVLGLFVHDGTLPGYMSGPIYIVEPSDSAFAKSGNWSVETVGGNRITLNSGVRHSDGTFHALRRP